MNDAGRKILRGLLSVDWPRALHGAGALMREIRGDAGESIEKDAARARDVGRGMVDGFENFGRKAVGCTGASDCACPFCTERKDG